MDIRSLDFDDNSFDVAIDKGRVMDSYVVNCDIDNPGGTMDAMMTAKGDIWVR